ncbi:MAG TPA: hypothetical protein DCY88_34430 [Cyanobacteria bacterium UBA11372]|nr:hypothetical protein [Cyanobacteria bacterium UBA11372]
MSDRFVSREFVSKPPEPVISLLAAIANVISNKTKIMTATINTELNSERVNKAVAAILAALGEPENV